MIDWFHCLGWASLFMKLFVTVIVVLTTGLSVSSVAKENELVFDNDLQLFAPKGYISSLSAESLHGLNRAFSSLYEKTDVLPSVSRSYFHESSLYNLYALPLTLTPSNNGLQFEVFGQFYDQRYQPLCNMSRNAVLYPYMEKRQNYEHTDLALGFGLGLEMSKDVSIKTLFSTGTIPGYGTANLAIGFEVAY